MFASIAAMIVDNLEGRTRTNPVLPEISVSTVVVKIGIVGYDASWRKTVDRVLSHSTLELCHKLHIDHSPHHGFRWPGRLDQECVPYECMRRRHRTQSHDSPKLSTNLIGVPWS